MWKLGFLKGLDRDLQKSILNQLRILWTYSSNAIEGNTLTLGETKFIIEEGLTISGKSLREHNEVINHVNSIEFIYQMLEENEIKKTHLFKLHEIIQTEKIFDYYKPIGAWKNEFNGTNIIFDGEIKFHEYPAPENIEYLMNIWLEEYAKFTPNMELEHYIKQYAKMHLAFVSIHPFFDGNGRIARLIANVPLIKAGFPPIMISIKNRKKYMKIISQYQANTEKLDSNSSTIVKSDNEHFQEFVKFCNTEYEQTLKIFKDARAIQNKRKNKN